MLNEGETPPLVTNFSGHRNPEGELVISGQFSRVLNPENVKEVIINGVSYAVNNEHN